MRSASSTSLISGSWPLNSSGVLLRLALYSAYSREPEGLPRDVEGDRDVGRLLVAQHVDQHRGEAVDRVGVLAGRGREVLDRQREERAVGQRVAVEQEQAGTGGLGRCGSHGPDSSQCDRHARRAWSGTMATMSDSASDQPEQPARSPSRTSSPRCRRAWAP